MNIILDTNVIVVANGNSDQASTSCVEACVKILEKARKSLILIDNHDLIINEYRKNLNPKGQPGLGDAFFQWLWENHRNINHAEVIEVTPTNIAKDEFEEFPTDDSLRTFDRSDRKFVAVSVSSKKNPTIYNAVDSGWVTHEQALKSHQINIRNIRECQ